MSDKGDEDQPGEVVDLWPEIEEHYIDRAFDNMKAYYRAERAWRAHLLWILRTAHLRVIPGDGDDS